MASDEEPYCEVNNLPKSKIGGLILRINKMLKKPVIDFDLNETLDTFLSQLNENQQYLSNGIFNVKFAEAGLFLQSSVALYSKKVDLLWDTTVEYQMQLCTYNKAAEGSTEEATKIAQRMNKKRKKAILHDNDPNSHLNENVLGMLDRSDRILEWSDSSPYYDELKSRWKMDNHNRQIDRSSNCLPNNQNSDNQSDEHTHPNHPTPTDQPQRRETSRSPVCDILFPINKNIVNEETGEVLCKYSDIYLNCVVPQLAAADYSECSSGLITNIDRVSSRVNNDWLLQKYLKQRRLTYKMLWTQELGDSFEEFRKSYQQQPYVGEADISILGDERDRIICRQISVVNLTRLPEELMVEYVKQNDFHVRTLIKDLILREKQNEITSPGSIADAIKKGSERISNADSAFQDETFHDAEGTENNDTLYSSQQSNTDSGFFSSSEAGISLGDSEIFCKEPSSSCNQEIQDNVSTSVQESTAGNCFTASEGELEQTREPNSDRESQEISRSENSEIDSSNNDQVHCGGELQDMEPNLELIGRNEYVESAEKLLGNKPTEELPPFSPMHIRSIIKPAKDTKLERDNSKRKLKEKPENKKEKRRRITFHWLKTTSASLKQFEMFFLQHYEPEYGEVEEGRILPTVDDSDDDDAVSVISDLVAPDLDEVSEEVVNTNCSAVDIGTTETSESRLEDFSSLQELGDSLCEESNVQCTLNNTDHDQEVPVHLATASEILSDPTNTDVENSTEVSDPIVSNQCITSASTTNRSETATVERIKAVSDWRKFIEPKLQEAEKASKFDIHEYGTRIMDAIPPEENLNFVELARGKQAPEVVRLFLASLQLANTYNVELITPQQGELANDKFQLKLLTRERYHEHLDEYEAPSENSFRERLARVQALHPSMPLHSTPAKRPVIVKPKSKRQKISYT